MPEEHNRILTDHMSDLLFTICRDADQNLAAEGIGPERIRFVGNTMIDSLDRTRASTAYRSSDVLERLALRPRGYCVATLHRPSNVDSEEDLSRVLAVLAEVGREVPVVYPVHPRARARVTQLLGAQSLRLIDPLGYLDFLTLLEHARLVVTDSGGVQEETTVLGVPCLTARETTERPVTIIEGTNRLIPPSDPDGMLAAVRETLASTARAGTASPDPVTASAHVTDRPRAEGASFAYTSRRPELWDGRAGERIVAELAGWCGAR